MGYNSKDTNSLQRRGIRHTLRIRDLEQYFVHQQYGMKRLKANKELKRVGLQSSFFCLAATYSVNSIMSDTVIIRWQRAPRLFPAIPKGLQAAMKVQIQLLIVKSDLTFCRSAFRPLA